MKSQDIAPTRLLHQQLNQHNIPSISQLVEHMGCIQAQEYASAKWAISCRIPGTSDADIDHALQSGAILRTHILRPTWQFVSPADIGWILQLTAPKIKAFNKHIHNKLNITDNDLKRSKKRFRKALIDQGPLTRQALAQVLIKARINIDDIRMSFLLMDAELDGLICSGGRQGKQFTYDLLEKRAPHMRSLDTHTAIGKLASRYFLSRGPATIHDFAWWSGLGITKAKQALEMIRHQLSGTVLNGQAYWSPKSHIHTKKQPNSLFLLPAYDEYAVAYKDRSDLLPASHTQIAGNGIFKPIIVINGQVAGTWKRYEQKQKIILETQLFTTPSNTTTRLLNTAIHQYSQFIAKEIIHIPGNSLRIDAGAA
ncbi:winged helix DNA-binding domain-containing protein [Chitinophaga pendula]|uniref:winged helix DNA-binding domain-containing protein n=1 Tax=Chitinophaga TaxID=79328 RepID=UPI000BAF4925|nr:MULTISPECIES: winged helix DNA-binding domain-containing protein [Chitinophaga]ASZ11835.1 hypothetical protein CK934_13140 [Chitinophaga sp. MD30]UCJ05139.1 winged helix DNA-binding domain-containing protein [Chitinophaga pendula]